MSNSELSIPPHLNSDKLGQVWLVDYHNIASLASDWSKKYGLQTTSEDKYNMCIILVDVQNKFCIPEFELLV